MWLKKCEYALKICVAGTGVGIAALGGLTFVYDFNPTLPLIGMVFGLSVTGLLVFSKQNH